MKLWFFTPSSLDMNLGKEYNEYASLVRDPSDLIVFLDRDAFFIQPDYHRIITENISKHRNIGLFSCLTNRVGNSCQNFGGKISEDPNVLNHFKIGDKLAKTARHNIVITHIPISGHVMIIQKNVWDKIGGAPDGLLGVDNIISARVRQRGYRVGILLGLYVFHFYRFNTKISDKSHLQIVSA